MTSGNFHSVPLDSIVVKRDDRQRRELTDIGVLADSIRRLGLIHPLVVTRELELVAGERRHAALTKLGWTHVTVQYVDELDEATLHAIELEENIKRKDISWQDQANAIQKYHNFRAAQNHSWTKAQTAEAIGLSPTQVSSVLQICEEMAKGNKSVIEAPKQSVAEGIVRRAHERRDSQVIERLQETLAGPKPRDPESILVADFREWVLAEQRLKFNFLHVDFPYGIGADEFNQGAARAHGGYEDTPEEWEKLMFALENAMHYVVSPSAHLMFWFAMRKGDERLYEGTARRLQAIGWDINPMPLIWMKSDGTGILPDPERGPRQIYETCFLGSRGDRKIVRAVANAYSAPTSSEHHMSEKPEPMLRHFFRMLVDTNTTMLDPTCGSGSALRAAESLGARYVLGIESNPEFAEIARQALKRARNLRRAEAEIGVE